MIKIAMKSVFISFLFIFTAIVVQPYAFCKQPAYLQEGIDQYRQENYEESVEVLIKARKEDPNSSVAAFFLGMAYKQTMDYQKAFGHFKDAVNLTPRIKEALPELIDVGIQIGELDEAKKWIAVGEEENIFPSKIAFLKGLLFKEEGKYGESVAAFEKAKSIDPSISQSADIQIAIVYVKENKLKKAKTSFQAAIQGDPLTDLASFARRYQDLVANRIFLTRPWRFTLGVLGLYDTNLLLKPVQSSLAPLATDEETQALSTSFKADFVPQLEGPWIFNAQYAFSSRLNDKHSTSHDFVSNGIYIAPGYNFGDYALNFAINYNHTMVRQPSYKKYLGYLSAGPLLRILIDKKNLIEIFGGYINKEYFQPALIDEDDRDSKGISAYISWIWSFKPGAFFNLKYQYTDEDTDGIFWEYNGNIFSANLSLPVRDKLVLQISSMYASHDYKNINTFFQEKRADDTKQGSIGLTYDMFKHAKLIVQYNKTKVDSTIPIYEYKRSIYTLGLEYRF